MRRMLCLAVMITACFERPRPATPPPAPPASVAAAAPSPFPLAELKATIETTVSAPTARDEAPRPPGDVFERVRYEAPLGDNVAYVTPPRPVPGPAIVWIAGGFDWGIDASAWEPAPRDEDQSARAFREAGIALMLPALRGSNDNAGHNECFFGEVDDILAAARFLADRPDVDPEQVYLGGHSTGGTLALLTAASSARFRAIFALGPVADARAYGASGCLPEDLPDDEAKARRPDLFLSDVKSPTYVIEGYRGNVSSFGPLESRRGDAPVTFIPVPGEDHFTVLTPATEVIARAIVTGDPTAVTETAILKATGRAPPWASSLPTAHAVVEAQQMTAIGRALHRTGAARACDEEQLDRDACDRLTRAFSPTVLESLVAATYAERFPEDELTLVLSFMRTPAGEKLAALTVADVRRRLGLPFEPPAPVTSEEEAAIDRFIASPASKVASRLGATFLEVLTRHSE